MAVTITVICFSLFLQYTPTETKAAPKKPKKIYTNVKKQKVYIGQKYRLKISKVRPTSASKKVKWKSSNKKVATVNKSGVVKGIKKGTATITATSKSNPTVKVSCKITVLKLSSKRVARKPIVVMNQYEKNNNIKDQNLLISKYSELKQLKKMIKKNYDYPEKVLKKLNKYNKSFFKKKCFYYTKDSVMLTRQYRHYSADSVAGSIRSYFSIGKVEKKIINGKVVCSITATRNNIINEKPKLVDDSKGPIKADYFEKIAASNEYIVEFNKKDIKDVDKFKKTIDR